MRYGISNLVFARVGPATRDALLAHADILDFAPTALYGAWAQVPRPLPRQPYEGRGPVIGALQSLFFGVTDASLVKSAGAFERLRAHFESVAALAASSGVPMLIFGSPGTRSGREAGVGDAVLLDRVRMLADSASAHGVQLCFEVNAPRFGCEYLASNADLFELLAGLDHDGLALHLDVGQMLDEGLEVAERVRGAARTLRHLHLSAPDFTCRPELLPLYRDVIRELKELRSEADIVLEVQTLGAGTEADLVAMSAALAAAVRT